MTGFDSYFLGKEYKVQLPILDKKLVIEALNKGEEFPFMHYSLVMNRTLRTAIYAASNVDKSALQEIPRSDFWHYDTRIGENNQIGNEAYKNNDWDRGHLARRRDLCWGTKEEAKKGNYDSFCFGNITLQHKKFNQGIWGKLEDWVLEELADNSIGKRLSIFTGPIINEESMEYNGADNNLRIPVMIAGYFFKVICYVGLDGKLGSIGFIMKQTEYLTKSIDMKLLKPYRVKIMDITKSTGIIFQENIYVSDLEINDKKEINIKEDISKR